MENKTRHYIPPKKKISSSNTSAVSSINLGSILIFASCVIHRPLVFRPMPYPFVYPAQQNAATDATVRHVRAEKMPPRQNTKFLLVGLKQKIEERKEEKKNTKKNKTKHGIVCYHNVTIAVAGYLPCIYLSRTRLPQSSSSTVL